MKQKIKIIVLSIFLVAGALVFTRSGEMQTKPVETAGQRFKNIKVLTDMPADQMGKVMNLMSASLGVNCNFCHVENDFAKDGKEEKEAA
ncbi:MAG: photosynthetic reaction center cytochrome c subunit, partial [Acidobacteria bacterium]|nr:photosynthetic reaction center cytochrome c subunit [Acidobacteriota bacterium]